MEQDFGFLPGRHEQPRAGEHRELLRTAIRDMLKSPHGLRVMNAILDRTGLFAPTLFTRDNGTFYLVGRRDVGAEVQAMLMDADPEAMNRLSRFRREHEENHERAQDRQPG